MTDIERSEYNFLKWLMSLNIDNGEDWHTIEKARSWIIAYHQHRMKEVVEEVERRAALIISEPNGTVRESMIYGLPKALTVVEEQ